MKRLWLGVTILLFILGAGIFSAFATEAFQKQVSRDLILAAEAAAAGEWSTAQNRYHQALERWQQNRLITKLSRCRKKNSTLLKIQQPERLTATRV